MLDQLTEAWKAGYKLRIEATLEPPGQPQPVPPEPQPPQPQPPTPLPPHTPGPVTPATGPLPATAPLATPADPALVRADAPGGGEAVVYVGRDRWGLDYAFQGTLPLPNQDYSQGSPVPGSGQHYSNFGCRGRDYFRAAVSGVHEFYFEGRGEFDWHFAGEDVLEDATTAGDYRERIKAWTLEAGKYYYFEYGINSSPDGVPEMRIQYRTADQPDAYRALPSSRQFPPATLWPAPPPVTPPAPPLPQPDPATYHSPVFEPDFTFFPRAYEWYRDVLNDPVDPNSDAIIAAIGGAILHPEFGAPFNGVPQGFPINVLDGTEPMISVEFEIKNESDLVQYRVPVHPVLEQGGDCHYIGVDRAAGLVYELYNLTFDGTTWRAYAGVVWRMDGPQIRRLGDTSADASGCPMVQGMIRPEEVFRDGRINHAIRVTVPVTRIRKAFVFPANHMVTGGGTDALRVPMGARFRMKFSTDMSMLPGPARIIAEGMKRFGLIVVDGTTSNRMFFSGCPDASWDNNVLAAIKEQFTSNNLELLKLGEIITNV